MEEYAFRTGAKRAVAFLVVALVVAVGGYEVPHSEPAIFNTEHWIPLKHTDQPTFTAPASSVKPLPPVSESWQDPAAQIFVGVAHYRDRRCSTTLVNLFEKAQYPDRVHVGVIEQTQTELDGGYSCIEDYCAQKHASIHNGCPHVDQIRIIQLTHNDARGPNFARYMQESLRQNEEFCLQIDAHSDFAPHWDTLLTEMWGSVQNEYAILSSTPVDIAVLKRADLNGEGQQVPHLCQAKVDERGAIVSLPPALAANLPRPILSPLYAAGNAFSKCHAMDKVPADPNLQMIFEADEFPTYARLWTRGYDVYTPNKIAVAHDYYDQMLPAGQAPLIAGAAVMEWAARRPGQAQFNRYLYDRSLERIATQLSYPAAAKDAAALTLLTRYGLGRKRTLEEFIEFTGVDTRKKTVFGDRCDELHWVPYKPEADPFVDSQDIWGGAPELLMAGGANNPLLLSSESVTIYPLEAFENAYTDAVAAAEAQLAAYAGDALSSSGGSDSSGNNPLAPASAAARRGMDVVNADAKYLRAKAGEYAADAQIIIEKDMQELEELVKHRGKELWWLFQPLDSFLEGIMNQLDREFGPGMGSKVMKVILLLLPVLALIAYFAQRALQIAPVEDDLISTLGQQMFASPSPTARKHNTTGKQH